MDKANNINRLHSKIIVDELIKNGITQFYISPGMRNAPLIAAISDQKEKNSRCHYEICIDERAGAYRALGYAKATGRPAVLVCTSGTALANYFPAVIEASKSKLPLFIISCDRPIELVLSDDNQTIDQTKIFGSFVQGQISLEAPHTLMPPRALASAISNLVYKMSFPQMAPVHLNLPFRSPLENTELPIDSNYQSEAENIFNNSLPATRYTTPQIDLDVDSIFEMAQLLKSSQRGMLAIGGLPPYLDKSVLIEFVEKLNFPTYFDVGSSLKYLFPIPSQAIPTFDHPEFQEELLKNPPDLVFHIGDRITSSQYYTAIKHAPKTQVISLNQSREKEDPAHVVGLKINAPIISTIKKLLAIIEENKSLHFAQNKFYSLNEFKEKMARKKIEYINQAALSYPVVTKTIIENIEENAFLYIGNSTAIRSFDAFFSMDLRKHLTIAVNRGVSGIEGAIASAVGAMDGIKKDVYLALGDISLMHDLNSLYFLKNLPYALKIIVINNKGGGIFTLLPIAQEKNVLDIITSPHEESFELIAKSFQLPYFEVSNKETLKEQFLEFANLKTSAIMEINVSHNINKEVYDFLKTIKN